MSQRSIRVNELVKREISDILHTRYRSESVYITITDVEVSPNLRTARVFYSVIGNETRVRESQLWLDRNRDEIRHFLGKRVVLKYLPHLSFRNDPSIERGMNLISLLDELEEDDRDAEK
jgi:ribosome-binding factor A